MKSNEPLIEARDASFGYDGSVVISGVNVIVRAGDRIAVAGPNGAGKTTLFRGLLGLIQPQSGVVRRMTERVAYVPQRESLDAVFPFTAREVVEMGALGRMQGANRYWRRLSSSTRRFAAQCLHDVGLANRQAHAYADLSGGQRQRVLIARALMTEPRMMFLDEPTSGVDRAAAQQITEVLSKCSTEHGVSIVIVGHHLDSLREFADRALLVTNGRVVDGRASELLTRSAFAQPSEAEGEVSRWKD